MKDFLFHVKYSPPTSQSIIKKTKSGDPMKKKVYDVVAVKIIGEEVWFVVVKDKKTFTKIPAVVCDFEGFGKKEK